MIRYAYLWSHDYDLGREEGVKDRPAAVVLTIRYDDGLLRVLALPITHSPPSAPEDAVLIPGAIKNALGLDQAPSWIVVTEVNTFTWPGPDLRPIDRPGELTVLYGALPARFFKTVRDQLSANIRSRRVRQIPRSQ